jgi:hypothetical protein
LLLQVHIQTRFGAVLSHGRNVGWPTGLLSQRDGSLVGSQSRAGQKAGHRNFAGAIPERVAPLDFAVELKLAEARIEIRAIGDGRDIERAAPESPGALVPLRSGAICVSPGISGIVIGPSVDERPIHKILAGILRVLVLVKNVRHRELSNGQNQPVSRV